MMLSCQGDGDRIFMNAKLELLLCDVSGHIQYHLNCWRKMAYETAILSPRLAYNYKWNSTVNLQSDSGNNIPNDNMVELYVDVIKRQLRAQGANMTFASAKTACDTIQMHELMCGDILKKVQDKACIGEKTWSIEIKGHWSNGKATAGSWILWKRMYHNHKSQHFNNFVCLLQKVCVQKCARGWWRIRQELQLKWSNCQGEAATFT